MILHYEERSHSIVAACMYWHPAMITSIMAFVATCLPGANGAIAGVHLFLPRQDVPLILEQLTEEGRMHLSHVPGIADNTFNYGGHTFFLHGSEVIKAFSDHA